MKKIIYKFTDGTTHEVMVTDEFYEKYQEIEKKENNKNRAETRRHTSLSYLQESGFEGVSNDLDPEESFIKSEKDKEIQYAVSLLSQSDRDIIDLYFYQNKTIGEIAEILNVQKPAVSKHLARILKKLKSLVENGNF